MVSQLGTARVLYSAVFVLGAMEFKPALQSEFWTLIVGWAVILLLGYVNWQAVVATTSGREEISQVQGIMVRAGLL